MIKQIIPYLLLFAVWLNLFAAFENYKNRKKNKKIIKQLIKDTDALVEMTNKTLAEILSQIWDFLTPQQKLLLKNKLVAHGFKEIK